MAHYLVDLARRSVEHYLNKNDYLEEKNPPPEFLKRSACFVTIKKHGELRGCIGTIQPESDNLALEVIHNSVRSAVRDPRFLPMERRELAECNFSVDVLHDPEEISSKESLDPKRYGVIITQGSRRGLLLPDIGGVNTVDEQVSIAARKGGIDLSFPYTLERFEVERLKG